MRKSRFTEAQIVSILKELDAGTPAAELARRHGLPQPTNLVTRLVGALSFLILTAAIGGTNISRAVSGEDSESVRAFVRVELVPQSATYRSGQVVRIAFSFINLTSEELLFPYEPPEDLVRLVIVGPDGRQITPGIEDDSEAGDVHTLVDYSLEPGGSLRLKWLGAYKSTLEYCSLADWGYHLSVPGTYTVRAVPTLGVYTETPDHKHMMSQFRTDYESIASNTITITITP